MNERARSQSPSVCGLYPAAKRFPAGYAIVCIAFNVYVILFPKANSFILKIHITDLIKNPCQKYIIFWPIVVLSERVSFTPFPEIPRFCRNMNFWSLSSHNLLDREQQYLRIVQICALESSMSIPIHNGMIRRVCFKANHPPQSGG
jgi:hypothetical protein